MEKIIKNIILGKSKEKNFTFFNWVKITQDLSDGINLRNVTTSVNNA